MDRYPYPRYTILLDTTRALAHIGVHILHNTLSAYQVFGAISGDKFSVDINNKAIRYYSRIFVFILFYKCR